MKRVYEQIGTCLAHAIRGLECPEILDLDIDLLMKEAEPHDIEGLIYKALKNQVDLSHYKQRVIFKCLMQATYFKKALESLSVLQQHGITIVVLKGSVLKSCYPQSDLRTMGDVDILVPNTQLKQVHKILTHLGYTRYEEDHEKNYVYDKDGFHLEVHWLLLVPSKQHGGEIFEQNLWNHLCPVEIQGMTLFRLSDENFLIHLIVHMAGHCMYKGFGIRQLCDLVLWIEQHEIDMDYVINQLKSMKLLTFTSYLMAACEELLDFKAPTVLKGEVVNQAYLQTFIDTLFEAGVHGHRQKGTHFGHYFGYKEHKSSSWRIFLKFMFPSIQALSSHYVYAHQHHWLLPIAWIHRFFNMIFNQRFSFSEKLWILVKTPKVASKKTKLLQSLELVEK